MTPTSWLIAGVTWPLIFALGFELGRLSETHKENLMQIRTQIGAHLVHLRTKSRALYDTLAPVLFILLALVATIGVWLGATASLQARETSKQNGEDLVTQCLNGNESRAAAKALWSYVIDVSAASNPDARTARFLDDFRAYVGAVYVPHDCSDLSRKYPLPDAPRIPSPGHTTGDTDAG